MQALAGFTDDADSRLVEEAMMLRRDNPDLAVDDIVGQVAAERGVATQLEPDGPIGVMAREEEIEFDDDEPDAEPVDVDALVRRLRDIENDIVGKVEPHLRTAAGQAANGQPVDARDAATLLLLADNIEGFADRIRKLAQCED